MHLGRLMVLAKQVVFYTIYAKKNDSFKKERMTEPGISFLYLREGSWRASIKESNSTLAGQVVFVCNFFLLFLFI